MPYRNEKQTSTSVDYPVVAWMLGVHLLAIPALWTFSWEHLGIAILFNFLTGCVGITLTFHRLLTHRSYQVPKWFERILATFGTLAMQGSPLEWVAHHRMHHAGSDTMKDPHNAKKGFWFSHWGWLFIVDPEFEDPDKLKKFARDIWADPYYRFLDRVWVQLGIQGLVALMLFAIGGWGYVIWGVTFRLVMVYHSTWLVNSAAHIWGYKNYEVPDSSCNNWFVALLTWGEGWHNNHHAHEKFAEAGHKWWEFDITMMIIRFFKFIGLAKNIKSMKGIDLPDTDVSEVAEAVVATT